MPGQELPPAAPLAQSLCCSAASPARDPRGSHVPAQQPQPPRRAGVVPPEQGLGRAVLPAAQTAPEAHRWKSVCLGYGDLLASTSNLKQ